MEEVPGPWGKDYDIQVGTFRVWSFQRCWRQEAAKSGFRLAPALPKMKELNPAPERWLRFSAVCL